MLVKGRLSKNAFKSKNAFAYLGCAVTVGQLVLYQYGSDKKLVNLWPEVPTLKILLNVLHIIAERKGGMR